MASSTDSSGLIVSWSKMQSSVVRLSHTWTIDNFTYRFTKEPTSRTSIESASFNGSDTKSFKLKLYPNGKWEAASDYLSLSLYHSNYATTPLIVDYKFAIIDSSGCNRVLYENQGKFISTSYVCCNEIGVEKYISRADLLKPSNGYLLENQLTILCEIGYVINENITSGLGSCLMKESINELKVLEDIGQLLSSGILSDVTLVVGGKKIAAHKCILVIRSAVFKAMFEHNTKEKVENQVDITDVKPEVFEMLLNFIYTGKVVALEQDTAVELLAASDKYQMDHLKSICEDFLCSKLSVESAPNFLLLADSANAPKLKQKSLEFIKSKTTELMNLVTNDPNQLMDMFRILAQKSQQNDEKKK